MAFPLQCEGMRSAAFLKAGLASLCFAALHSALASRRMKRAAEACWGSERVRAHYRLYYVGQSLATFVALLAYGATLPREPIYRARGATRALLRLGQCGSVLMIWRAAHATGIARVTGLDNWRARRLGQPVPPGPAAQGPELDSDGALAINGPFRWTRHPLNVAPLGLFWLTPDLTTKRLAFNIVSTAYLIAGSKHEEVRLSAAYPGLYAAYRESGVPFYLPSSRGRLQHAVDRASSNPYERD